MKVEEPSRSSAQPRPLPGILVDRLAEKKAQHSRRVLSVRRGLDFSSNDYLGLSEDLILRRKVYSKDHVSYPVGSSGSRLLRGQLKLFEEVESELADFSGAAAALIFPSGYQCNVAVLSSIANSDDIVFSDEQNHASLIDGIRLSGAKKHIYPHLDLKTLTQLLENAKAEPGLKIIVTESLFSMSGSIAPLSELADLADDYGALLVVDEAHATGLWGDFENGRGGGLVQSLGLSSRVFATLHTGGKALGVGGAWVAASREFIQYLINFSRPFIFSTAPVPILALSLRASVERWKDVGPERVEVLRERCAEFNKFLQHQGMPLDVSGPIFPILVGGNQEALALAGRVQAYGVDVRAIRPPTVPEGTARLRVVIHWQNDFEEVQKLARGIFDSLKAIVRSS